MVSPMQLSILAIHPEPVGTFERPSKLSQVKTSLSATTTLRLKKKTPSAVQSRVETPFMDGLKNLASRFGTNLFHILNKTDLSQLVQLVNELEQNQPNLRLSLDCMVDENSVYEFTDRVKKQTLTQVQWHVSGQQPPLRFFKSFSRIGVWNHLVPNDSVTAKVIEKTASGQPNIIHSWETINGDEESTCYSKGGYDQVTPLPGRPLWQSVNDPVHRLVLLETFGRNWLLRSRVDENNDRLYRVGDHMEYQFCPPDRLPHGYIDEICAMVAAGGTVAATHVRFNLERAYLIGYVKEKGIIVGNSSLKNPRSEYIETVQRQSGLDLNGYVERGYTSVRPEYRGLGIGTKLLEGLTRRAGDRRIFSVISEDNEATKIIAKRNRTRKVATYFSEKAGKPVGIWMPEWMIDK